jgi:hypothetical protein
MAVDYATIYSALYNRVAVDSAGSAVRAMVGTVMMFHELGNLAGKTLPYLVWQPGVVSGASGTQRGIFGAWTAYTAPNAGPYALHQIMGALETLYGWQYRLALSGGEIVSNGAGQVFYDDDLSLNGQRFQVSFLTIG